MGERATDSFIIRDMIGPGPNAEHERSTFMPDAEWQLREIARLYTASQGEVTYLGDWHTHPNARSASLSRLDLTAMAEVLSEPKSQTRMMVMVILYGSRRAWQWAAWSAVLVTDPDGSEKLVVQPVEVKKTFP